ncbi:hypothetical protein GGR55DRAFT_680643 [Xylaria sp. FL0064]|nr:hypothetical protein GGR55DRAFT_680643 [Xylaria sp. FL0064]
MPASACDDVEANKMGGIVIVNNTAVDIKVRVTAIGSDFAQGGSEDWFAVKANGGKDTWGSRAQPQVVFFARTYSSGAIVETILAIPGKTVNIY